VGTLWSELAPIADHVSDSPRVYVDANLPAGLVAFMRTTLGWDVLFVIEHPQLRRARDIEHFRLARQLSRTLITLDHDYLDERTFPSAETAGVLVLSAPDERGLAAVLTRFDHALLRPAMREAPPRSGPTGAADYGPGPDGSRALPLAGRKLHVHSDWMPDGE
jgi:hypothetical protein